MRTEFSIEVASRQHRINQELSSSETTAFALKAHKQRETQIFSSRFDRRKMGKQPVKLKAVVYALSPYQQKVMTGLWKDLPGKIQHKVSENWLGAVLLLAPLVGTYA